MNGWSWLNGEALPPLFGIPVMLKDNINTAGIPTSAGAVHFPAIFAEDAGLVRMLKAQGAVILSKTISPSLLTMSPASCPADTAEEKGRRSIPFGP